MERIKNTGCEVPESPLTLEAFLAKEPLSQKAFLLASEAHKDQKRDDGTPYITHPESVARIVVEELQIKDPVLVASCLLHDTVEDTEITLEDIRRQFGPDVADLVDGVTQIKIEITEDAPKLTRAEKDRQNERKVIYKNSLDPRVGILKAACDRLHNMRTLDAVAPEKQKRKARETLIYAKLLESLGVWRTMIELEDRSFYFTDRTAYEEFKKRLEEDPRTQEFAKDFMTSKLESVLEKGGIEAQVNYRTNGLSRLKNKMEKKTPEFSDITDVTSYRIVVDDGKDPKKALAECFQIFHLLRSEFRNEEDVKRFDDFLSYPTDNGYSALQMTVMMPGGAVEIAITTKSKEDFNNWGVVSLLRRGQKDIGAYALTLTFTVDGDVKFFKPGATGIDFAYSIDPSLGAKAVSLIVDGVKRELSYVLKNGQTIEVVAGEDRIAPLSRVWLTPGHCQPGTRKIIEEQFLEEKRVKLIELGREKVAGIIRKRGLIELGDLMEIEKYKGLLGTFLTRIGCKGDIEKFYYQIGSGRSLETIERQLDDFGITRERLNLSSIFISGDDHHGIARIVTGAIDDFGANIEHQTHKIVTRRGKKIYQWRIVTEGLSENDKEWLKNSLDGVIHPEELEIV